jgi:hypothetical protein
MLLTLFRRHVWTRTLAALLAAVVCGVNWVHVGGDDPGCDPVPIHSDQSARHVSGDGPASGAPAEHCPFCHFLRLLQTALSAKSLAIGGVSQTEAQRATSGTLGVALVALHLPSRAPPAVQI